MLTIIPDAPMVIKSTIPVGYTKAISEIFEDVIKVVVFAGLEVVNDFATFKEWVDVNSSR